MSTLNNLTGTSGGLVLPLSGQEIDGRQIGVHFLVELEHFSRRSRRLFAVHDNFAANEPRIFPYNHRSAIAAYVEAKKRLGIKDLRFQDLRREAAIRLYEAGHSVEQIAKVTGRIDLNTLIRDIGAPAASSPERREPAPLAAKA